MNGARRRGFTKGLEQGIEQGHMEAKTQMIEKLSKKGLSSEEIADLLELSKDQVQDILNS